MARYKHIDTSPRSASIPIYRKQWTLITLSPVKETAIRWSDWLNGSNLLDNGHSPDPRSTAAMAEEHSIASPNLEGKSSA
ncbi:MAG: hypothetical protein NTV11_10070 [Rhodocyclales bacterium]|nr:hypothetical protein [Rhodocyclales bacterium]